MTKLKKIGYSLKDVTVIQAPISMVEHRGDVNPYTKICEREVLPVFVAPMATVTDEKNYQIWIDNKVTPVIPRTVQQRISLKERIELAKKTFVSVSLSEAKQLYENKEYVELIQGSAEKFYICIDLAQGTMSILYEVCKKIKKTFSDKVELMSGNIANPEAYNFYCDAGIDWVRCSVGTGSRCVVEGTEVTMSDGSKRPIEDIDVGDCVKTAYGSKTVKNVFSKKTNNLIKINGKIECTPDHKFFVVKKDKIIGNVDDEFIKNNGEYIMAKDLTDEYLLVEE